ncbi:Protein STB6 [Cytospora mali]|uniref:Protein STB6 n=1 Tax=Cytospora mali TaxID=578113 RepID=A0A194W110_CYTMA|nr:Protein STB6 [Valsa mali]
MSSRLSLSASRSHREEELTPARLAAARNPTRSSSTPRETAPMSGESKLEASNSLDTSSPPGLSLGPRRRNVVFPDPVAFRYLAEDPTVEVVSSRGELCGYELYIVEQWACSRQSPTLVIVTYTGDPKHSVVVGVLAVPADEDEWSPRLKVYFKAIHQYHARPKETELGEIMITNLSSFPSALTVISVPGGDIKKHRRVFIVNEDLKRMGCSGRSGMSLSDPTPATQAKFYSTYKIHDKVPFFEAVMDLVKLCQVALFIFDMLDQEYIDGLLCDVTETAIGNWWTKVGSEYYNMEPTDGILGPTTVAALLGMLMGARNRLSSYGVTVAKDVFDVDTTKRAIGHFQKSQKLEKTRRLDRQTLMQLHKATAKAAAGEEWGVQKAIGATVSQFGKRGEILSGVIGTREKAGIGEIETVDIDKFKELAFESIGDQGIHKAVFKSVAGRVNDARSRLGRIGDAVGGGLRGHSNRQSRDETAESAGYSGSGIGSLVQSTSSLSSPVVSGRAFTWKNKPEEYANAFQRKHPNNNMHLVSEATQTSRTMPTAILSPLQEARGSVSEAHDPRKDIAGTASTAPSTVDEGDLQGPFLQAERNGDTSFSVLQRRHSLAVAEHPLTNPPNENRWPRRMSFSAASEAILRWDEIVDLYDEPTTLEEQIASAELMQYLHTHVFTLTKSLSPWVSSKVHTVESLEKTYTEQQDMLQQAYYALSDEYQQVKQNSAEMVAEERGRITEAIKDVEVQVAKLEYEISALLSKVQDVEDGVAGFEASVEEVEKRAEELKTQLETESWLHWAVRTLTGIGTGPNITRES